MAKRPRPKPGRSDTRVQRPEGDAPKGLTARRLAARGRAAGPPPVVPAAARPPAPPPAPPAPPPAPPGPAVEALSLFRQGMDALQRHQYANAAEAFSRVLERFPAEAQMLERVRVYLDLCQRELKRRPAEPRSVEERLTAATAALNDGDIVRAEKLARGVLADDPHQDLALYLLASVEVRRGAFDQALSYLGQAIALSPEARAQARHEPDFEPLRGLDGFRDLTDPPSASGGARRARRGRPGG